MIEAKIHLSAKEMELVMNADWILTKNSIMEKAKYLLENLQQQMHGRLNPGFHDKKPEDIYGTPKISKGENYKGLPYLVLDYPRVFQKDNTFAIRTMFWWGNFFSSTLHLSGSYKQQTEKKIIAGLDFLKKHDFRVCISEDEWEHHFETTNYIPLKDLTNTESGKIIKEKRFVKIATQTPLSQWNNAEKNLLSNFELLTGMLKINFPGDEKAL
ncbi:MAG: hypothetical protein ABUT20_00595 [Bacteroidota bacterium]